jgi:hypothetical protein
MFELTSDYVESVSCYKLSSVAGSMYNCVVRMDGQIADRKRRGCEWQKSKRVTY